MYIRHHTLIYRLEKFLILLLIISIIFDPANKLFHIKFASFILLLIVYFFKKFILDKNFYINKQLFYYVLLFAIVVPGFSALVSLFSDGCAPPEILNSWKPYILILLSVIISGDLYRFFEKYFLFFLTVLSIVVLIITILTTDKNLFFKFYEFGDVKGIFMLTFRIYGGIKFVGTYYVTSPLISISLAYWTFRLSKKFSILSIIFFTLNALGLFFSGTRNTMILTFLIPLIIFLIVNKNNLLKIGLITTIVLVIFSNISVLEAMFSATDKSNNVKSTFLYDYAKVMESAKYFFLGGGLGSKFEVLAYGCNGLTELTYLELFRVYGLLNGTFLVCLLIFPPIYIFMNKEYDKYYIAIGYICYLIGASTNPLLFSSNGISVVSFILASLYKKDKSYE